MSQPIHYVFKVEGSEVKVTCYMHINHQNIRRPTDLQDIGIAESEGGCKAVV